MSAVLTALAKTQSVHSYSFEGFCFFGQTVQRNFFNSWRSGKKTDNPCHVKKPKSLKATDMNYYASLSISKLFEHRFFFKDRAEGAPVRCMDPLPHRIKMREAAGLLKGGSFSFPSFGFGKWWT